MTLRQLISMASKKGCLGNFNLKLLFNVNKLFFLELIRGGSTDVHSRHLSYPRRYVKPRLSFVQ